MTSITENRLKELETDGRNAMPLRAELQALVAAYRSHQPGLRVTKRLDGVWLHFEPADGPRASVSLECVAAERPPIVRDAINGWADSVKNTFAP